VPLTNPKRRRLDKTKRPSKMLPKKKKKLRRKPQRKRPRKRKRVKKRKNNPKSQPRMLLILSHPQLLIFSPSKLSSLMLQIKLMLFNSSGPTMTHKDIPSGTSNTKSMREKESNYTLPPTLRTPHSKDLILLESTFSEHLEFMEKKETTKLEESGSGEELKSQN